MIKKIFLRSLAFGLVFWFFGYFSIIFAQGSCSAIRQLDECLLTANGCQDGYTPEIGSPPDCRCNCVERRGITNPIITGGLAGISGVEFVNKLISFGISIGFIVAAIVFFFMFISGGIRWITSGGDKGQVEAARSQLTHAVVGLLLTFMLYVILGIIENFFGISLTSFNLPKLGD